MLAQIPLFLFFVALSGAPSSGLRVVPTQRARTLRKPSNSKFSPSVSAFDPFDFSATNGWNHLKIHKVSPLAPAALALLASAPAEAASMDALPSAVAAYGHYLGLLLTVGSLTTERLLIKPNMSDEEEEILSNADIVYGISGLIIVVTGYLRVTQYGKGWEFYSHSPIFWVKITLLAVMGAASFFPTTVIIQRAVKKANGEVLAPMSDKLVARMTSIMNAELLAIASIPLAATLMARGVGYAGWFPWQAGAAPVALCLGGLGFKYVKEALDWEEA